MRLSVTLIFLSGLFSIEICSAQEQSATTKVEALQKRVLELETQQEKLDEWYLNFYMLGKGRLSPFTKNQLSIGGYFDTSIIEMHGPDMDQQVSANNHSFGLNLSAELTEKITFASQIQTIVIAPLMNAHNNPKVLPKKRQITGIGAGTLVTQGYLEYRSSDVFNIQSGVGYIPFGLAYSQRELVLFHQRNGPQIIQNDDGFNIMVASALWLGLHVYGQFPIALPVGYNLYTITPGSKQNTVGGGGRLWAKPSEMLALGFSFQYGERQQGSYLSHGFDLDLQYRDVGVLAEYISANNSGVGKDAIAYYVEPYYKFLENKWLVFISAEYLRSLEQLDIMTLQPDPFEKMHYGAGVNWIPLPTIRIRLCYLKHDYLKEYDSIDGQRRDYETIELSTALAF